MLRVHGVNLASATISTRRCSRAAKVPLCVEVDRLVKSGVSWSSAAGNTGYGSVGSAEARDEDRPLQHDQRSRERLARDHRREHAPRRAAHVRRLVFLVEGPTGDGRLKPDLVAPGERITSCAAGPSVRSSASTVDDGVAAYVDDSGTSMAAPHVSGAIAAFLSIRREFIQRPEDVKRIFLESATSLGRERYFEGHGLVDLMRAIQSV